MRFALEQDSRWYVCHFTTPINDETTIPEYCKKRFRKFFSTGFNVSPRTFFCILSITTNVRNTLVRSRSYLYLGEWEHIHCHCILLQRLCRSCCSRNCDLECEVNLLQQKSEFYIKPGTRHRAGNYFSLSHSANQMYKCSITLCRLSEIWIQKQCHTSSAMCRLGI